MRKLSFIVLVFCSFLNAQESISKADLFAVANTAYEDGDYSKAIELYEGLALNYQSSDLYRNLGNAHFRQNNLGKAILYFEKAVKINPGDEDAQFNLTYANNLTVDRLGEGSNDRIDSFFRTLLTSTASDNWAYMSIIIVIVFFILLVLMILNKRIRIKRILFLCSLTFAFLSLVFILFAYQSKNMATSFSHAIIIDEKVDVKSEPNEESTDLFVLHEGAKVEVVSENKLWIEIAIPNGTKGWIELKDLEKI